MLLLLAFGCTDRNRPILNEDFNSGNWILVKENLVNKTLFLLDDEQVLTANSEGIQILNPHDCSGTTCDGNIKLFKNGKLVRWEDYWSEEYVKESETVKQAYRTGIELTFHPNNDMDFRRIWDSLTLVGCYPTVYRMQPGDRKIIVAYKPSFDQ